MALKHVLLGIGFVAAVGAGYLAYRYATGVPANATPIPPGMGIPQETGATVTAVGAGNHLEAKPTVS